MENKFHANLKLRAEHSPVDLLGISENSPRLALGIAEFPNFEICNNYCRMNIYAAEEHDEGGLRFFHCLRAACQNTAYLALVTGKPAVNLSRFVELALRRAASEGKTKTKDEKIQELELLRSKFQLQTTVKMFLPPPMSDYVLGQLL
jgi:hypothetical protein